MPHETRLLAVWGGQEQESMHIPDVDAGCALGD